MNVIFDEERFSRNVLLNGIGFDGQAKILNSSVACVGSGGLASHVLPILASCGVGKFAIIDFDEIASSNLPRQTMFREQDLGLKKVDCAKKFLLERNSSCKIEAIYSPPHKHLPRVRVFHCAAGCKAGLVKQARPHDERLQAETSLLCSHPKWVSAFFPQQVSICACLLLPLIRA